MALILEFVVSPLLWIVAVLVVEKVTRPPRRKYRRYRKDDATK
jgi:hypothetical protein